jgi:crotonobetainyl-CoA:carnitine CoA-transferase CaiB-like acyl-CoA transferase
LFEELQAEIGKHTRQFLLDEFQKQGVPAGAVYNMAEVFAQPEAADMVLDWHLPDGTAVKSVRSAVFELKQ